MTERATNDELAKEAEYWNNGVLTPAGWMPVKKLKSLEEHNKAVLFDESKIRPPQGNGIACPKCGAELRDDNDGVVLTSNPPQFHVHCSSCTWKGTRF